MDVHFEFCKGPSYGEGDNRGGGIRTVISFGGRGGTSPGVCIPGGLGYDANIFGGSRNDSRSRSGGGGASSGPSALAGAFPAVCGGQTAATSHHFAEPAHNLVRSVFPGVEPRKVVLV